MRYLTVPILGLTVAAGCAAPRAASTLQDKSPDLGSGSLSCSRGGGTSREIFQATKERDVYVAVDPGECRSIVYENPADEKYEFSNPLTQQHA